MTMKNWSTDQPSRKLDNQQAGLYKVLERVSNSFQVDIPDSIRVYPIFSPDKLRKDLMNPIPGQYVDEAEPIMINGEKEYEVEEILAARTYRGKIQYKAK